MSRFDDLISRKNVKRYYCRITIRLPWLYTYTSIFLYVCEGFLCAKFAFIGSGYSFVIKTLRSRRYKTGIMPDLSRFEAHIPPLYPPPPPLPAWFYIIRARRARFYGSRQNNSASVRVSPTRLQRHVGRHLTANKRKVLSFIFTLALFKSRAT